MLTEDQPAYKLVAGSKAPLEPYQVDVIILALNRFAETMEAVASALLQKNASFYIAVLDQGSSTEIRARFAAIFHGAQHVGYFVGDKNLGVAGGRNLLSSIGHGQIILGLDNDAILGDDTILARSCAILQENSKIGALAFKILRQDGFEIDRTSWGYPKDLLPRSDGRFTTTTYVGAGHAIRRTTWLEAGGYDPAFFFTWEEYDFCLRAIALGWLVTYDGSLFVIHKVSKEARLYWSETRTRLFIRNRLMIARKWNTHWTFLVPRILGYLARGVCNGRLAPTMRGILEAIRADSSLIRQPMPKAMREYLFLNDQTHRGSLMHRLRTEVFIRVPADP